MAHRLLASVSIPCLCLLLGCASAHDPEEPIASGVYSLTIRTAEDHCSPRRLTGALGEVGVVSLDGALSVPVPESEEDRTAEVTRRVTLEEGSGFHAEWVGDMTECPTAQTRREWTVTGRSAGAFEVEYVQRFEGLSECGPMDGAPEADCESVRHLEFQLVSACGAPCELVWTPDLGVGCACP